MNNKIIFIFLFLLFNEIICWKCGKNLLDIKPRTIDIGEENEKRRLAADYTKIKIGYDFSNMKKPSTMSDETYQKVIRIISETASEFRKFLSVQHTDIRIDATKDEFKQGCRLDDLSNDYENFFVDNDVIIFPFFKEVGQNVLAAATMCLLVSRTLQPIGGILYINPKISFDSKNTDIYLKGLLLHEITHILIFDNNLFEEKGMTVTRNGVSYVNTPKVLEKAKTHFKCNDMKGVHLEDQGGTGSAGSHWEARYMLGDYMISTDYFENFVSDITLALFEDSGFYKVDYPEYNPFRFGKDKGCDFLNENCIKNEKPLSDEFCSEGGPKCSYSRTMKGYCMIGYYSTRIPSQYQYFKDEPTKGGFTPANYCPVAYERSIEDDHYPTSCKVGNNSLGDYQGDDSFCFISSLAPKTSDSNRTEEKAMCYKVECDNTKKQLKVHVGSQTLVCSEEGKITNKNFDGELTCPKYTQICSGIDSNVCNDMFSCLSLGKSNENYTPHVYSDDGEEDIIRIAAGRKLDTFLLLNIVLALLL